jgi:hypothetical protein
MDKKYRINLEFPPAVGPRLAALQLKTEAASKTEVLRRALDAYKLLVDYRGQGARVFIHDADGTQREVILI